MTAILRRLNKHGICRFHDLFNPEQGAAYVVVNFISLLELAKEGLVRIVQEVGFGEIRISLNHEGAHSDGISGTRGGRDVF